MLPGHCSGSFKNTATVEKRKGLRARTTLPQVESTELSQNVDQIMENQDDGEIQQTGPIVQEGTESVQPRMEESDDCDLEVLYCELNESMEQTPLSDDVKPTQEDYSGTVPAQGEPTNPMLNVSGNTETSWSQSIQADEPAHKEIHLTDQNSVPVLVEQPVIVKQEIVKTENAVVDDAPPTTEALIAELLNVVPKTEDDSYIIKATPVEESDNVDPVEPNQNYEENVHVKTEHGVSMDQQEESVQSPLIQTAVETSRNGLEQVDESAVTPSRDVKLSTEQLYCLQRIKAWKAAANASYAPQEDLSPREPTVPAQADGQLQDTDLRLLYKTSAPLLPRAPTVFYEGSSSGRPSPSWIMPQSPSSPLLHHSNWNSPTPMSSPMPLPFHGFAQHFSPNVLYQNSQPTGRKMSYWDNQPTINTHPMTPGDSWIQAQPGPQTNKAETSWR